MTAPTTLADVRPGDLFFTNIGGIVPGIFPVKLGQLMLGEHARIGRRSFDHVGIVTGMPNWEAPTIPLPSAVQAMPRGAEEIHLRAATHWTNSVTFMRLPEDYPGQAEDAAAIARAMIGTPYSFLSYAALAAWRWGLSTPRLEAWIGRRDKSVEISLECSTCRGSGYSGDMAVPDEGCWDCLGGGSTPSTVQLPAEAICSVLADQAWSLTGKKIFTDGRPHQCVTPGALASRLLWMPGVEKFGKGIL